MVCILRKDKIDVNNRLAQFGLTRENLLEVINAMVSARANCTENDPPGAAGWQSWCNGTRRLREETAPLGYVRSEDDQISSAINTELGIRILVSNTDAGTGLDKGQPQNRSKKGAGTERTIDNNQSSFIHVLDASLPHILKHKKKTAATITTWYLCVHSEGETLRAELSCPIKVEDGFFADFAERIILIDPKDNEELIKRKHGNGETIIEEFDIPVKRKK